MDNSELYNIFCNSVTDKNFQSKLLNPKFLSIEKDNLFTLDINEFDEGEVIVTKFTDISNKRLFKSVNALIKIKGSGELIYCVSQNSEFILGFVVYKQDLNDEKIKEISVQEKLGLVQFWNDDTLVVKNPLRIYPNLDNFSM